MAVAASSGTLIGSFRGDPLAGHLRGKTGSLSGVVGLAGLVDSGARARFAFLAAGDFSHQQGQDLQVAIGRIVGSYPVVRPPADLVPAP
jgi:D-alanyl-D-alanine carboxypeptidase